MNASVRFIDWEPFPFAVWWACGRLGPCAGQASRKHEGPPRWWPLVQSDGERQNVRTRSEAAAGWSLRPFQPLAAPKPADCGFTRLGSRVPSALYCEFWMTLVDRIVVADRGVPAGDKELVERVVHLRAELEGAPSAEADVARERQVPDRRAARVHVVPARLHAVAVVGGPGKRCRVELLVLIVRAAAARIADDL